ncbi:MAG: PBP1A family penicillin-binding protein [Lachnospiraceae bacterium]|nr:PBP1A family penicillin-binding protein [Lachnospiraceae bacterium]
MNFSKKGIRRRQRQLNATGVRWGNKVMLFAFELLLVALISLAIIGAAAGIGVFRGILASAPDISNIDVSPSGYSTFVYDAENNQIAKLVSTDANRVPVTIAQIPEDLAHAFVAIEDARFYEHNGIDIQGIVRAFVVGIKNRNFSQGASTITQQLLKNNVFSGWTNETFIESVRRKIQEQYLALELEKVMDKDSILENYMNTINLGQNTLGVQAASDRYFNKNVSDLTLSECAVIAGITQNPSKYNPITHPDDNAERREKVLNNMLSYGFISQEEYNEAMADDVYSRIQVVNSETADDTINSYFVDALVDDVLADLVDAGYTENQAYTLLYSGGLKIYSTMDPTIQSMADAEFSNEENYPENTYWLLDYELTLKDASGEFVNYSDESMVKWFKENVSSSYKNLYSSQEAANEDIETYKAALLANGGEVNAENISLTAQPQVSLTIQNQSNGYVVAMVGGRGTKTASRTLNRAADSTRQPGSTFKVLSTYAPALDSAGLTLATVHMDEPYNYENGRPVNNWYTTGYRGICSLRDGIRDSLNIIAVKTLTQITPQLGFDYLMNFGFTTLVASQVVGNEVFSDIQQSLALGGITKGVTNEELNAAYATIANGGTYYEPILYTKITDHDGNVILDKTETQESRRVIKETTAFLLTDAMVDVVTSGTGASVNFGNMAIAGKTGTTSDYKDVWFAGYTPYYTATVWAGYDDNTKLSSSAEKALAKKLWKAVMQDIHADLEYQSFSIPSGIVTATVCAESGLLPVSGLCDGTLKTEYFAEGTVPTTTCNVHYSGLICAYDGLPASEECPFKIHGVITLNPDNLTQQATEGSDESTAGGEEAATGEEATDTTATVTTTCQHNAAFFADPNFQALLDQQMAEMNALGIVYTEQTEGDQTGGETATDQTQTTTDGQVTTP